MARFQALTNAVLEAELERLREELGLAKSQKADLLKEMATIVAWVLRQARAGRAVEARAGDQVERLEHPALDRLRSAGMMAGERIVVYGDEVDRFAEILRRPFKPTPALVKALANLADPHRKPPAIRWREGKTKSPPKRRKTRACRSRSSR